ncbi:MAG: hypothetical protein U0793_04310 [Gemmataceae bacterium]
MLLAASEFTNQALPPFSHGAGVPLLFGCAALLALLTFATYFTRRTLTLRATLLLLALRLGALFLIVLLIWRPCLATEDQEALVPSRIFLLLDCSQSMAVTDEGGAVRWQRAKDLLEAPAVADALQRLAREKKIEAQFFQGALDVKPLDGAAAPVGKRTEIGLWLNDLLARRAGANLRGVILLSDGIDNGRKLTLDEAAKYRGICKLYTLGFGKATTTPATRDIALVDIKVDPDPVPVKSKMTVKGTIDAPGFLNVPVKVTLQMEDIKDGKMKDVASTKVLLTKEKGNEVILSADAPARPGEVKVALKVEDVEGDTNKANNEIFTFVPVTKGGVTILWVEGTPRHEAAFAIRQALAKDKRFRVFYALKPRDGKAGAEEDFFDFDRQHYDVVVIGDISAKRFSGGNPALLTKLKEMVRRGTGLLMMGGFDTLVGSDWVGTEIAALLPTDIAKGDKEITQSFRVEPTAFGKNFILRLADKADDNEKLWRDDLGAFDGASRIGPKRDGATELAYAKAGKDVDEPIMVSKDFGGGRVITMGLDTTHQAWIFGQDGKSTLPAYQRFWKQLMLWLAHQELGEGNLYVSVPQPRVDAGVGQRLDFEVVFKDSMGTPVKDPEFSAKVISPSKEEFDVTLAPDGDKWKGTFLKVNEPGEYTIKVTGKGKDGKETLEKFATGRFIAYAEDLENIRVAANPDFLDKIATAGGGKYFPGDETKLLQILDEIAAEKDAPTRPKVDYWPRWQRQPASDAFGDQWEALWSTPNVVVVLLFVLLISLEWALRRKWGMV